MPNFSHLSNKDTYKEVLAWATKEDIAGRLNAFRIAANSITRDVKAGSYHLIVLNLKMKNVRIYNFSKRKLEEANTKYTEIEKQISNHEPLQVVLVSTDSVDALQKAYPNYFLDTKQFLEGLNRIKHELTKI